MCSFARGIIPDNRADQGQEQELADDRGKSYPGEHQDIVSRDLFDRVQRHLAELRPLVRVGARATQDAPLAGLLFDETGTPMLPTYTVKGQSRRYRYYVSRPAMKGESSKATISRIPAPPLEELLSGVLRRLGLPAGELHAAIHRTDIRANDTLRAIAAIYRVS